MSDCSTNKKGYISTLIFKSPQAARFSQLSPPCKQYRNLNSKHRKHRKHQDNQNEMECERPRDSGMVTPDDLTIVSNNLSLTAANISFNDSDSSVSLSIC